MRRRVFAISGAGFLCLGLTAGPGLAQRMAAPAGAALEENSGAPAPWQAANVSIGRYCLRCHNDSMLTAGLSLESFDAGRAHESAEITEKIIRKLRTGMMPPAQAQRPDAATYAQILATLETRVDEAAAGDPGERPFQRLNRAEYAAAVRDLLDLEIDAGAYLPLDAKSANFDNIADAQLLSPTLMDAYLRAAGEVSRLAVGDPNATAREATFKVSRWASQRDRVDGAPFGTRGGTAVMHNFPADGDYEFKVSFHHETTGALFGNGRGALHTAEAPEQLEISIDGTRVALLELDRWMHASDPNGVSLQTEPVAVRAGPHRVAAAFVRRFEGPLQDLISPHDWSLASTSVAGAYGITSMPHLRDLVISGPHEVAGVSETPSRQRIFTCRPTTAGEERECAEQIVARLGAEAYRRPLGADDTAGLMGFYEAGATESGFESGIRITIEAILASPHFVFRIEEVPASVEPGTSYRISDVDLASRLSFFLWASIPDDALVELARRGELSRPEVLDRQVDRMLADRRSSALASRFAAQWLRLQDLEKINPDVREYPDFDEQLRTAMRRETELFFNDIVARDRDVLELLTADYTFVNERLARHYGIRGVSGPGFRRVALTDEARRGLLGQGSILTLTSHAARTSPVLRGKWVMEVLLGSPPPPPPPDVPELEETVAAQEGRLLSVRERMEQHRANPACRSCHNVIDPIGLALENFDATGAWRVKDNGVPIEASGELYDGSRLDGPQALRAALMNRPEAFLRTFTENLMAYAVGRRIEYYDMPTVRRITRDAAADGNRVSALILGIVRSPAFQMSRMATSPEDEIQRSAQDMVPEPASRR